MRGTEDRKIEPFSTTEDSKKIGFPLVIMIIIIEFAIIINYIIHGETQQPVRYWELRLDKVGNYEIKPLKRSIQSVLKLKIFGYQQLLNIPFDGFLAHLDATIIGHCLSKF